MAIEQYRQNVLKNFLSAQNPFYQDPIYKELAPMSVSRNLYQYVVLSGPPSADTEPTVVHTGTVLATDPNQAVLRATLATQAANPQVDLSGVSVFTKVF